MFGALLFKNLSECIVLAEDQGFLSRSLATSCQLRGDARGTRHGNLEQASEMRAALELAESERVAMRMHGQQSGIYDSGGRG